MNGQITLDDIDIVIGHDGCGPCICRDCMRWWSGRCPNGGCYDDWRNIHKPYDKAHPGEPPRTLWSNWKTDQGYWCRGGTCYSTCVCEHFIRYGGSVVKSCLEANVQIFQDGYMICSLLDILGCEECYRRFEERTEVN